MELSPEERQRIYAEEKARLESQQQSAKAGGQEKGSRVLGLLMIIVGVLMALIVIAAIFSKKEPEKPGSDTFTAQLMAQKFIEKQLRAPAGAEFGDQKVAHLGSEKYLVIGYVDAQNAFGAKLRKQWTCTVEKTGEDQWTRHEPCMLIE